VIIFCLNILCVKTLIYTSQGVVGLLTQLQSQKGDLNTLRDFFKNDSYGILGIGCLKTQNVFFRRSTRRHHRSFKTSMLIPMREAQKISFCLSTRRELSAKEIKETRKKVEIISNPEADMLTSYRRNSGYGNSIFVTILASRLPERPSKTVKKMNRQALSSFI